MSKLDLFFRRFLLISFAFSFISSLLIFFVQLVEGFIGGKDTGVKLGVFHCMDFVSRAKEIGFHHLAIEWLQMALKKADESNDPKAVKWKVHIESDLREVIQVVKYNNMIFKIQIFAMIS